MGGVTPHTLRCPSWGKTMLITAFPLFRRFRSHGTLVLLTDAKAICRDSHGLVLSSRASLALTIVPFLSPLSD
jgi:hypothetical protein